MTKPLDLHSLASKALNEIELAKGRQTALLNRPQNGHPWLKASAALALVAIMFMMVDGRSFIFWLGVSEQQQLVEMTAALTAAKVAVEQSRTTTGEWPDRVPLPALAALVELQNPGPEYRLLARTNQWQLTMTPSGDLEKVHP